MLVLADKPGQLGNRLLIFASAIATAERAGTRVVNPAFDEYAGWFRGTGSNPFSCYPPLTIPVMPGSRRMTYWATRFVTGFLKRVWPKSRFWEVISLSWQETLDMSSPQFSEAQSGRALLLQGWLIRDVPGLRKYRGQIVEFFRLQERHEEEVRLTTTRLRTSVDLLVGVHIRQGDYNEGLGRRYFLQTADYVRFMHQVRDLLAPKKVRFLISSNVPQDLKIFKDFDVADSLHHPALDMYLLAKCDYLLGPPSSFSYWASFVGDAPIFTILSPDVALSLEDACTFPTVQNRSVRELYLGG